MGANGASLEKVSSGLLFGPCLETLDNNLVRHRCVYRYLNCFGPHILHSYIHR